MMWVEYKASLVEGGLTPKKIEIARRAFNAGFNHGATQSKPASVGSPAETDPHTGRTPKEELLKQIHVAASGMVSFAYANKIADRLIQRGWHKAARVSPSVGQVVSPPAASPVDIPCPYDPCRAAAGQPCKDNLGTPDVTWVHAMRQFAWDGSV